jgi:hypothetical protein
MKSPPMNTSGVRTTDDGARFGWLEDQGRDFPYYRGQPVALTAWQWLFVMAAVGVGFMAVALPIAWPGGMLGGFVVLRSECEHRCGDENADRSAQDLHRRQATLLMKGLASASVGRAKQACRSPNISLQPSRRHRGVASLGPFRHSRFL